MGRILRIMEIPQPTWNLYEDIKRTFDAIDVDGTGLVEWNEYAFSLMGEKAMDFGTLTDLETIDRLSKGLKVLRVNSDALS